MQDRNTLSMEWIPYLDGGKLRHTSPAALCSGEGMPITSLAFPLPEQNDACLELLIAVSSCGLHKSPPAAFDLQRYHQCDPAETGLKPLPISYLILRTQTPEGATSLCVSCALACLTTLQQWALAGGRGHTTSARGGGPLTTLIHQGTIQEMIQANRLPLPPPQALPWESTTLPAPRPETALFATPRRVRLGETSAGTCSLCRANGPVWHEVWASDRHTSLGQEWGEQHPLSPQLLVNDQAYPVKARAIHPDVLLNGLTWHPSARVRPAAVLRGKTPSPVRCFGFGADRARPTRYIDCVIPPVTARTYQLTSSLIAMATGDLLQQWLGKRKGIDPESTSVGQLRAQILEAPLPDGDDPAFLREMFHRVEQALNGICPFSAQRSHEQAAALDRARAIVYSYSKTLESDSPANAGNVAMHH